MKNPLAREDFSILISEEHVNLLTMSERHQNIVPSYIESFCTCFFYRVMLYSTCGCEAILTFNRNNVCAAKPPDLGRGVLFF